MEQTVAMELVGEGGMFGQKAWWCPHKSHLKEFVDSTVNRMLEIIDEHASTIDFGPAARCRFQRTTVDV